MKNINRRSFLLSLLGGTAATAATAATATAACTVVAVKSSTSAVSTTDGIITKLGKVDEAFSVSANDLAVAIARAGAAAKEARVSMDELISHATKAKLVTGRSGDAIGNSLKTIYTRVGRREVQRQLADAGVQFDGMEGFLYKNSPFANASYLGNDVLRYVTKSWPKLSVAQQTVVAEALGGVYHVNVVRTVFGGSLT